MPLLLTIVSALEAAILLLALLIALHRIREALERVRHSVMRISWGVRAIESETAPLGAEGSHFIELATRLAEGLESVATHLNSAEGHLAQLVPPQQR